MKASAGRDQRDVVERVDHAGGPHLLDQVVGLLTHGRSLGRGRSLLGAGGGRLHLPSRQGGRQAVDGLGGHLAGQLRPDRVGAPAG